MGTDIERVKTLLDDYRIAYRTEGAEFVRIHSPVEREAPCQAVVAGENPQPDADDWNCGLLAFFVFDMEGRYLDYFLAKNGV